MKEQNVSPALGLTDLNSALLMALFACLGAMAALTLAAAFFPPPTRVPAAHSIILDSQAAQLLLEPRKKVFYALVIVLSGALALLGGYLPKRFRLGNWSLTGLLAVDVAALNYVAYQALNGVDGLYYGAAGFLVSALLIVFAYYGGRHA